MLSLAIPPDEGFWIVVIETPWGTVTPIKYWSGARDDWQVMRYNKPGAYEAARYRKYSGQKINSIVQVKLK